MHAKVKVSGSGPREPGLALSPMAAQSLASRLLHYYPIVTNLYH
jgi:hypothetical protein